MTHPSRTQAQPQGMPMEDEERGPAHSKLSRPLLGHGDMEMQRCG